MSDSTRDALEDARRLLSEAGWECVPPDPVEIVLRCSREFDHILTRLAREVGGNRADAVRKALIILETAVEARREGKRLVVVDDRENTEEDVEWE